MENGEEKQGSIFERHLQSVIVAVLLALLLWTGNTLLTIKDDVTTLKVQVTTLQTEVRAGTDDRFRGSDWRREREIIEARLSKIEAILDKHVEITNGRTR